VSALTVEITPLVNEITLAVANTMDAF
jgi:hypothetical protein